MRKVFIIIISIITFISGCSCIEPDLEYVKNDFIRLHPNCKLINLRNIEVSPPCFYWFVEFKSDSTSAIVENEVWQYWDTDQKCYWELKVIDKNIDPLIIEK